MRLIHTTDYAELSRRAADFVGDVVSTPGRHVIGLPTGQTAVGMYRELVARSLDWRQVWTFNLDEYVGLDPSHPASFCTYMRRHLFDHCGPGPSWEIPDSSAPDPHQECARYEAALAAAGPMDLLVLGLGRNGHIGFNEPGSPLDSRTRVVPLTAETRLVNRTSFPPGEQVPVSAITMGIATILSARRILLLVSGHAKALALKRLLDGPVLPDLPASALRRHGDVTVLADEAALRLPLNLPVHSVGAQ